jgi:hypothetical protein
MAALNADEDSEDRDRKAAAVSGEGTGPAPVGWTAHEDAADLLWTIPAEPMIKSLL